MPDGGRQPSVTGVLLAAGSAERFGADKRWQPLPSGLTIAEQSAARLVAGVPNSVAVVRPGDARLAARLAALGLQVVVNPDADQGMGSSLACAVTASRRAAGWVIALADMPFINTQSYAAVAGAIRRQVIVVPQCAGRRGHPVGFGAWFGVQLQGCRGDQGARDIVDTHTDKHITLALADAGIRQDVDRPSDLTALGVSGDTP